MLIHDDGRGQAAFCEPLIGRPCDGNEDLRVVAVVHVPQGNVDAGACDKHPNAGYPSY